MSSCAAVFWSPADELRAVAELMDAGEVKSVRLILIRSDGVIMTRRLAEDDAMVDMVPKCYAASV